MNPSYYWAIYLIFAMLIPIAVPVFYWNETWWNSFLISFVSRYVITLHCTWFVNSTAHMFGAKPYNNTIMAVENPIVSFGTFGEGYHNYHHTFPWDYRASELAYSFNLTKRFIEKMESMGQAFNLKMASKEIVAKVKANLASEEEFGHSHFEISYDAVQAGG